MSLQDTVTSTQACEMMQISPRKLRELVSEGELHIYPDPRHKQMKRIPLAEINIWIEKSGPPIKRSRRKKTEQITEQN